MKNIFPILFLLLGIVAFFAWRMIFVQVKKVETPFIPHVVHTTLQPPQGSLGASVSTIQGDVKKQGRKDNDFKTITKTTTLVEGESVSTGKNGSVTVTIPAIITMTLDVNSQLDYLNALPSALVVREPKGSIEYSTNSGIKPFSIRSLGLLIQISNNADLTVDTDPDKQLVTVNITSGFATLAYSDADDNTKVTKVLQGQEAVFDYSDQTMEIK